MASAESWNPARPFIAVASPLFTWRLDWGLLSDPYSEASLGGFSWGVMLVGLTAASTFALVALALMRSDFRADRA